MVVPQSGVRALAELEQKAVETGVYVGLSIHGLLQTPEHARALFEARQPPYEEEEVQRAQALTRGESPAFIEQVLGEK
ncbi:Scr1 family TA system antitoxin-like transcriptional regulator [Streptomyces broussonetiae]|uniref:Scr1 family TA system antitoxin-like transcriptional regulator n=1 Tax=Streptomyces broussonetiae TaxID=2686304 RepID=UPI0035E233F1